MAGHYTLRLGDGTILGVDHDGLRTWQLDERAMVQEPGSPRWRPVRDVLADPPPAPSAPGRPVFTTLADSIDPSELKSAPSGANAIPTAVDDLPVIPLKPLDEDELPPDLPELELLPPDEPAPAGRSAILLALDAVAGRLIGAIEALPGVWARSRDVATPAAKTIGAAAVDTAGLVKRHARASVAALAVAALVGAAALAIVKGTSWLGPGSGSLGATHTAAALPPPAPPPATEPSPLPKEVEVAIEKLPHLTLSTIQLVLSRAGPDPASIFRRVHESAHYGASALPEDEARELRMLKDAVASALRGRDRQRVRAYDRMSPSRYLLVDEDARVMTLFSRGVRALPPDRRHRLQELFGEAIAAYYEPRRSATPGSPAAP